MLRKVGTWFKGLSKAGKTGVIIASLLVAGAAASPATSPSKVEEPTQPTQTQTTEETKSYVIEKKTVIETEIIPFKKTNKNDSTLTKGKTSLQTSGVNGEKTYTYEITYENGVEKDKKLIKGEVTKAPINQVTLIGTKVAVNCPNGTYTNTYGNEVCRPYESPSAPAGASARCRDGTYSFSQSRRGTCSYHGGVAQWL